MSTTLLQFVDTYKHVIGATIALFLFLFGSCKELKNEYKCFTITHSIYLYFEDPQVAFENCFFALYFMRLIQKKKRVQQRKIFWPGVEGCDWQGATFCIKVVLDSEFKTKAWFPCGVIHWEKIDRPGWSTQHLCIHLRVRDGRKQNFPSFFFSSFFFFLFFCFFLFSVGFWLCCWNGFVGMERHHLASP